MLIGTKLGMARFSATSISLRLNLIAGNIDRRDRVNLNPVPGLTDGLTMS